MIEIKVNGRRQTIAADPDTPLLYVLRGELQLNAAKYGCGLGQCGSCTVLVDGEPAFSCVVPVLLAENKEVTTLEGLGTEEEPGPLQRAFIAEQAAQCGYCLNGMIMTAKALLARNPHPSEAEVVEALRYNLCRCGAHLEIIRAVMRAAA